MKLLILRIISGLGHVVATEFCLSCRPVELQAAPGVGIDLTMAYGTVAINFRNGTILDLGKIDGSSEYRSAMKTLAADAIGVRQGLPSTLPEETYYPPRPPLEFYPIFPLLKPLNLYRYLVQQAQQLIPCLQPKPRKSTDPWIIAVAEMLLEVRRLTQTVDPPIDHNLVVISHPDFEADTSHIYKPRFLVACQQAGLEMLASVTKLMSHAAMEYHGIDYFGDNVEVHLCDGEPCERIGPVLTITYNDVSLGITLLTRWLNMLFPAYVSENFNHGANSLLRHQDAVRYWEGVKSFIAEAINKKKIDYLMILGSHAMDRDLLKAISEAFDESNNERAFERYSARAGSADDYLFTSARGAARIARYGMIDGYDACIVPNTCEKLEVEHSEISVRDQKIEL